jgi:hypothetical protein
VEPSKKENIPTGHDKHAVMPAVGACSPRTHHVQLPCTPPPHPEDSPGLHNTHAKHAVAPLHDTYVFSPQSLHANAPGAPEYLPI